MKRPLKIGIIGDYNPNNNSHTATNMAIGHAAQALDISAKIQWLPTPSLEKQPEAILPVFDALWCSPGSPYRSMAGALQAIRLARENGWPFMGTWGGFQHTLVEYARNVLTIENAEHEETSPDASVLLINQLSCSLAGEIEMITLKPNTLACEIYQKESITEAFTCNYGLNPEYQHLFKNQSLIIAGTNAEAEVRLMELTGHRFFMATLFLPQLSSSPEKPHPLIVAYLKAASEKSS